MGKATLIEPADNMEGLMSTISPKNGEYFELKELQEIVGGYIEIIRIDDAHIMVLNEYGKDGLPINHVATAIARITEAIMPTDYICGDVVYCKTEMVP